MPTTAPIVRGRSASPTFLTGGLRVLVAESEGYWSLTLIGFRSSETFRRAFIRIIGVARIHTGTVPPLTNTLKD